MTDTEHTIEDELLVLTAEKQRLDEAGNAAPDGNVPDEIVAEDVELCERICAVRPNTLKGVVLKMKAMWYPSDRDELPTTFADAVGDLERLSGVSLDE